MQDLLSYVPNNIIEEEGIAYSFKKATIQNIDNKYLLSMALKKLGAQAENKYSKSDVLKLLKQMYNIDNIDIKNSGNEFAAVIGALCFTYNDNYFEGDYCAPGGNYYSNIKNYSANDDEVIIYERVSAPADEASLKLKDYYTKKEISTDKDDGSLANEHFKNNDEYEDYMKQYFTNNKEKFTKYKNTFKKNDYGYYWYSTEAVD